MSHTVFISHGGGPLPLLGDTSHDALVESLTTLSGLIKPDAIIVFSAHWESADVEITSSGAPELIYDYSGFPEESYQLTYPVEGNPKLAASVSALLENAGIKNQLNPQRGIDHGVFVPLKIMYPNADIPCIQVSLLRSLDPQAHINIGKALQPLREQNILFIGSGFSFHNMHAFFAPASEQGTQSNLAFDQWLNTTLSESVDDEITREQQLVQWATAPSARFCHPREEHLLPLHICYGLTQAPFTSSYQFNILGVQASAFHWGPQTL